MSHWYHVTTMPTSEFFRTELLQYDNWLVKSQGFSERDTDKQRQTDKQTETKKMDRDRARRQSQRQR